MGHADVTEDMTMAKTMDAGATAREQSGRLLTVRDVAGLLHCSPRTVYRLADSGRMPGPVRLGALVRWPGAVIEQWIAEGCPNCRKRTPG